MLSISFIYLLLDFDIILLPFSIRDYNLELIRLIDEMLDDIILHPFVGYINGKDK